MTLNHPRPHSQLRHGSQNPMQNDLTPARQWLAEQLAKQRDLLMIMNKMKHSDPMVELFRNAPVADYVSLYKGTEFEDLAWRGPWLVRIEHHWTAAIDHLLTQPQQHWGWLGSVPQLDLRQMAVHWRDRLLIHENNQRLYYRFQDNRLIARHLAALAPEQHPLLLGTLTSALCWDGQAWQTFDNPTPALCPAPFPMPWADVPEPEPYASLARRMQLRQWVFENRMPAAQKRLRLGQRMDGWLDEQLALARQWQWQADEQVLFLVAYRLDPEQATHPAWQPQEQESPQAHYLRCRHALTATEQDAHP